MKKYMNVKKTGIKIGLAVAVVGLLVVNNSQAAEGAELEPTLTFAQIQAAINLSGGSSAVFLDSSCNVCWLSR